MAKRRVEGRVHGPESVHRRMRGKHAGAGGSRGPAAAGSGAAAGAPDPGRYGPCGPAPAVPARGPDEARPAADPDREASVDTAPLFPLGGAAADGSSWVGLTAPVPEFEMPGGVFGAGRSKRRWKSREGGRGR